MAQGSKMPGWVRLSEFDWYATLPKERLAAVHDALRHAGSRGRRAPGGALPRRARDGGVGRGARLPRGPGLGAPRLAGRLSAGAARARGGDRGPHPAPPDPGRGADPPAPRPDRAGGADGGARPGLRRARLLRARGRLPRARSTRPAVATSRARGRRMDACLEALQRAFTGEPFEFEGRPVRVLPRPASARRAAAAARRGQPRGGAPRGALRARHADAGRRRLARRALPRRVRAARPRSRPLHRSARRHRHLGLRRRGSRRAPGSGSAPTCSTTRACTPRGWARAAPSRSRTRDERRRAARRAGALSHLHARARRSTTCAATACC